MASQDRKRVFSEAFQATPEPFSLAHRAMGSVATSIIDYSLEDTFDLHSDILCSTKENSTPIFEVQGVRREAPGIDCYAKEQFVPVAVQSRGDQPPHGYPLQDVSHQYMVGDDGPDQMLLGFDNECFSSPLPMHKTSTTVHDQAPYMSSSDLTAFWSTPPTSDYLYYNLDSNPGPVIYEDPDTIMCNGSSPINPPTPIDLHFQDLSLLELPESPLPAQPSHHKTGANRTNVFMLQSAILETYISILHPTDIAIFFARGTQVQTLDKDHLCTASPFFTQLLCAPLQPRTTHCLRLRNDFPPAIAAMLHFIQTGSYNLEPTMIFEHPHLTLLDLHVHAYALGKKYQIPTLCQYAMTTYVTCTEMVTSMGVPGNYARSTSDPDADPEGGSARVLFHFLNSLVLLWRNTVSTLVQPDALRAAVLGFITPRIHGLLKVPFFVNMMLELTDFGRDIVQSLEDDGFTVTAFPVAEGLRRRWVIRFAGADEGRFTMCPR